MRCLPSERLVASACIPLLLSFPTVIQPELWPLALGFDALVAVLWLVDLRLVWRAECTVERATPRVASLGVHHRIPLDIHWHSPRKTRGLVHDAPPREATAAGLPVAVDITTSGSWRVDYSLTPTSRGRFAMGRPVFEYASPMGFWRRIVKGDADAELIVYPNVRAVAGVGMRGAPSRMAVGLRAGRSRGGESEVDGLRDHRPEDVMRSIDWKATARRNQLTVRQYRDAEHQRVVFALEAGRGMTALVDGLTLFDWALNASLVMAQVANRQGDGVGMLVWSDRVRTWVPPSRTPGTVQGLVRSTFDIEAEAVEPQARVAFAALSERVQSRSLIIWCAQPQDRRAADELVSRIRAMGRRHLHLVVLFRDEGLERTALKAEAGVDRGFFEAAASAHLLMEDDGIVRSLRGQGAHVLRVPPRELGPALVERFVKIRLSPEL